MRRPATLPHSWVCFPLPIVPPPQTPTSPTPQLPVSPIQHIIAQTLACQPKSVDTDQPCAKVQADNCGSMCVCTSVLEAESSHTCMPTVCAHAWRGLAWELPFVKPISPSGNTLSQSCACALGWFRNNREGCEFIPFHPFHPLSKPSKPSTP